MIAAAHAEERKSITARMWAYRSITTPIDVFDFTVSRHRDGPETFLDGFTGTLRAITESCVRRGKEKGGVSCCDLFTNSSPRRAERIRHHARFYGSQFELSIRSEARQEAGTAGGDRDGTG